jgi:hypothetical protein
VDANGARGGGRDPVVRHSAHYLRKQSLHRVWWNSARVALMRGHSGETPHQPNGHRATGKRV